MCSVSLTAFLTACKSPENHSQEFLSLISDLLAEWSDGMLKNQIIEPDNLQQHGALGCPSCGFIHGRCMDAVYPFMHMANRTGDKKYLEAAILVMDWAQNNVSHGVKPCIHHTFAHAKPLAALLDRSNKLPITNASTPLPRQVAQGVKEFPEVATWLIAREPWRATVSAYD